MKIEISINSGVSFTKLEREDGSVAMVVYDDTAGAGKEWTAFSATEFEVAKMKAVFLSALDVALGANDGD